MTHQTATDRQRIVASTLSEIRGLGRRIDAQIDTPTFAPSLTGVPSWRPWPVGEWATRNPFETVA